MALNPLAQQTLAKIQPGWDAPPPGSLPTTSQPVKPVPTGPTGFWGRIAKVGIGKVTVARAVNDAKTSGKDIDKFVKSAAVSTASGFKGAATGITRMLPGGMNDINAQEQQASQAAQRTTQVVNQEKAGKISQPEAIQLTKQSANEASTAQQGVSKAVKAMPTTEQFLGDLGVVGSFMIPGLGKAADTGGALLLKEVGVQGVRELATQVGIDATKGTAEDVVGQLIKTSIGKAAIKEITGQGIKTVATKALTTGLKSSAAFGTFGAAQAMSQKGNFKQVIASGGENAAIGFLAGTLGSLFKTAVSGVVSHYKGTLPPDTINNLRAEETARQANETAQQQATSQMATHGLPSGEVAPPKELPQGSTTKALPAPKPTTETTTKGFTMPEKNVAGPTTQGVFGEGARVAHAEAGTRQASLDMTQQIDDKLSKVEQGKTLMDSGTRKDLFNTRQALATGENDHLVGSTVKETVGNYKLADQVYHDTVNNGGTTMDIHGGTPTGDHYIYAPSKTTETVIPKSKFSVQDVIDFQKKYATELAKPGNHIGAEETGDSYILDVAQVGDRSPKTIADAQAASQERVWDTKDNKSITIGQTDENGVYSKVNEVSKSNLNPRHEGETTGTGGERSSVSSTPLRSGESKSSSQATAVSSEEASLRSGKLSRPPIPPKEEEPLVNTNKPVKSLVNKFTPKRLKGIFNPVDAAARSGNTTFADTARDIAGNKIYALREGNNISNQFDKLYADYLAKGGTHQQFIKDIESGNLSSPAHKLWDDVHTQTGQDLTDNGVTKGPRSNYVGRVARFDSKKAGLGGSGLSKSGGFAKARAQVATDEFGTSSDKYATHADFKKAVEENGGQVLSDPRDIIRHTLPAKLEAIENAKGLAKLDKTAMVDGRPATLTFDQSQGLPKGSGDYDRTLLQGRAVHPDAASTIKALVHTYTQDEINNPVARANSFAKQIITLNGLVHGKNFGLTSLRGQGAIRTVQAILRSNKDLADTFGENNIKRAITRGGVVPFEQNKQDMFDTLSNPKATKTWENVVSFPGKVISGERKILFNKLGNHLQFSTYFNVEKQMLKQGLSEDEAARVAGSAAKNVSFISSPVETSVAFRKNARLIFFAGQYFKSTLNELGKAIGTSRDATLSGAAQRASQRQAIKGIARGFTYLLGLAQGINYATTGHSTFQNKDSKISPVFYVDKTTGKEYHITNFFGQLGDMMHIFGNPVGEMFNKVSPIVQEGARLYMGKEGDLDPYTGQTIIDKNASGWRQVAQALGNIAENMVSPLGFQLSYTQRSTPATVTFAKLLGLGASTVDLNPMEKDIANQYYATLPSGAGQQKSQQLINAEAAARNDLSKGIKNSSNIEFVKNNSTPAAFKKFMSTGASTATQRDFDALSTAAKLQIIEKYSPSQLKELDLTGVAKTLVGTSQKTSVTSLEAKGFTPQRILKDMQKIGIGQSQLEQIRTEAKRQAAITSAKSASERPFVNPLL